LLRSVAVTDPCKDHGRDTLHLVNSTASPGLAALEAAHFYDLRK
jgi:hypothetical protein